MTTENELIERALIAVDVYQWDYASALAKIACALAATRAADAAERQATTLELLAGKRGVIYTRDANAI